MYRLLGIVLVIMSLSVGAVTCDQPPRWVFFQPWNMLELSPQQRDDVFRRQLARAEINGYQHLIVQWTRHGAVDFFPDDEMSWLYSALANNNSLSVIYGLYIAPDFFSELNKSDQQLGALLEKIRVQNQAQATKISHNAPSAIAGWYLTEEIDDINWQTPERRALLKQHLITSAANLHTLNPTIPIYISAFFGGKGDPASFANLLDELHQATGIVWLIQDGLGVHRDDPVDTRQYLHIISHTIQPQGWQGVLEIFSEKKQLTEQGEEIDYCPATKKDIKKRSIIWCHATGKNPNVVFSLNQFDIGLESPASKKIERCAKMSIPMINDDDEALQLPE